MPIEVMLRSLEEVKMSLLAIPEENRKLTEVNLIDHALIKLSETGGFIQRRWKSGTYAWSLIDASGRLFARLWSANTSACLQKARERQSTRKDTARRFMPKKP